MTTAPLARDALPACMMPDGAEPCESWQRLRGALEQLVYEITHLSPVNDDGSHDCRISKAALNQARLALGKKPKPPTICAVTQRWCDDDRCEVNWCRRSEHYP